ncbi:MAG TPA: hypothetical protein VK797_29520 [Tepidisphaeraceae bacterium]|jgi:hypothetical protein|nr:hypothetical protein [Tepidisphaeraceae bacterium]
MSARQDARRAEISAAARALGMLRGKNFELETREDINVVMVYAPY